MGILIYGPAKSYSTLTSFHRRRPPRRWPRVAAPVNPSLRHVISATLNQLRPSWKAVSYPFQISILISKNFSRVDFTWLISHACNAVNTVKLSFLNDEEKWFFSIIFSLQRDFYSYSEENFTRQFHEPRRVNIDGYFGKCFPSLTAREAREIDDPTILGRAIKLINDESKIWCWSNGKRSDG